MNDKKYFKDIKTIVEIEDNNDTYKLQKCINFNINEKNNAKIYIGDDDPSIKFNIHIRFIDDDSRDSGVSLNSDNNTYYYDFINWDKFKTLYNGKNINNISIKKSCIANIINEYDEKKYELYIEINIIIFDNREETKMFTVNLYTKEI